MAVSEQTPYIEYTANGTATSFALEFDCDNRDHLIVLVDDIEPVAGAWSFSNGAVVFNTAPENGKKITLQRNTPFNRTTDYQSYNNSFRPPAVNNDFDRVWYKIQELGVKDWLLDLKIQKFRDDVNLTALENTLEEAKQIRDETANSVIEVQSNVAQSQTLLENTTAQANLAQGYANSANSANAAAQQAAIDVSAAEADVYSALSAQQIAVNNSLTAIAGGHKAYQTIADAQAAQATLPVNSIVEVTNDPTASNNGTYQWNGTTLTKSAYDPLTQAKAYVSNTGVASVVGPALLNINYVTATRTLEFKNTLFVVSGTSRYQLTTPQSVALPDNTPYRIEYNISTGLIAAVAYNAAKTEGSLVVGFSTASATTLKTLDFAFTVDGVVQNPPHRGELINDVATRINFNDATTQLIFSGSIRLKTPYLTTTLNHLTAEQKVIAYPIAAGTYFLQYDLTKKVFSFRLNSAEQPLNTADVGMVVFANNSVTSIKWIDTYTSSLGATYPPQNGELLTDTPSRIAFDTVNSLLTIAASARVKSPQYTVSANSTSEPKTVIIPTAIGIYQLQYDIKTGIFSFVLAGAVQANNTIALAAVYVSTTGLKVTGITNYTVDGLPNGLPAEGKPLGVKIGYLIAVAASEINFDFKTKQLIIAQSRVRLVATSSIPALLPAVTLDISGDEGFIKRLMYNTKTSVFRAIRANAPATEDEIQVALFCVNTKFVSGVPYYQINGSDNTSQKDDVAKVNFLAPYGKLDAEYTQPDLPAYTIMQTETQGDFTKMYALYDALMAQDPSHITKTVLGVDGLGNEIRQYQFNAPEVATVSTDHPKKPKIIIFSGVHGYEPTGVFNTFSAMKQIVERWKDDPHLEALYWGVNFIVVPVCNPSGFNTSNRYNHNDVDLARNFTADWSAAQTNSGGSPMSQAETVIMDAVMSNNTDAIYCFSHHNFHTPTTVGGAGNFIWNASATSFGRYLAKTLIIGQTIRAKKRYPESMPQTNDYYIGYADNGSPPGSEGVQATKIYGIQGGTFEICNRWFWEAGTPPNSAIVATMGVETLINWLLLNVKYACEFYNSRVNI